MGKKVGTSRPSDGVYMCGGGGICTKLVVYAGGYNSLGPGDVFKLIDPDQVYSYI